MSKNKILKEEFEPLFYAGKTQKEIAELLNVTIHQVSYFVRSNKYSKNKPNIVLSEIQSQMLLGSILGDLNIRLDTKNRSKNARLYIVHSEKQKELFFKKVEILGEFMGSYKLYNTVPDKRTNKIYSTYRGNSKAHKEFTKIYKLCYPNDIKKITKELLNEIYHPIALAYWFMDDGTNRGTLATNSFDNEEITLLLDFLKQKFNIIATRQKNLNDEVIHISSKSRFDFEKLIFPYIIPEMYYKLIYINELAKSV